MTEEKSLFQDIVDLRNDSPKKTYSSLFKISQPPVPEPLRYFYGHSYRASQVSYLPDLQEQLDDLVSFLNSIILIFRLEHDRKVMKLPYMPMGLAYKHCIYSTWGGDGEPYMMLWLICKVSMLHYTLFYKQFDSGVSLQLLKFSEWFEG